MIKVSEKIEVIQPGFLIAVGDTDRVEVLRSPLVHDADEWLEPVRQFISDHGLELAVRETFEDPDWMYGLVEVSVYVRNGVLGAALL